MDIIVTEQLEKDLLQYIERTLKTLPAGRLIGIESIEFEDNRYQVRCNAVPTFIDNVEYSSILVLIGEEEISIEGGRLYVY